MQVVLLSGLSGSGKSVALKALEDSGYYCVDNLPVQLFAETVGLLRTDGHERVAISIDARGGDAVALLPGHLGNLKGQGVDARLIFLDSKDDTLIRRFAETRRRHPLAIGQTTLAEAIARERDLLTGVAESGHRIDTSDLLPNTLRGWIKDLLQAGQGQTSLLFESFGFKQGLPLDADYVFDVRCLPNPFYDPRLKHLWGTDPEVIRFLENDPGVRKMLADIRGFLEAWLPALRRDNRAYVTVAIGCTGGQHRSVYLVEQLAAYFRDPSRVQGPVLARHRHMDARHESKPA
jgi:UPF0042 nucleotide-binding protein